MTPEPFKLFIGNQHNLIDLPERYETGGVSFKKHLGRPLSDGLWVDLHKRLAVRTLRIYRPDDRLWNVGLIAPGAEIYLDEHGNIQDIIYYP